MTATEAEVIGNLIGAGLTEQAAALKENCTDALNQGDRHQLQVVRSFALGGALQFVNARLVHNVEVDEVLDVADKFFDYLMQDFVVSTDS